MKRGDFYLMAIISLLTLSGCEDLELKGMIACSAPSVNVRYNEWVRYNEKRGPIVISDVPDTYRFYVTADVHVVEDSANRMRQFIDLERNDTMAYFSILLGDLARGKGEKPYAAVYNAIQFDPTAQAKNDSCFVIIGNHDLVFDCYEYYKAYFHTSFYTVDVVTQSGQKDLFVFMDSGNGSHGQGQLYALQNLLINRRNEYRHCVVCTHIGPFRTGAAFASHYPEEETYAFLSFMTDCRVDLVLVGHDHYKEQRVFGGVQYLMADNLSEEIDKPNYIVVECGERIDYEYRDL